MKRLRELLKEADALNADLVADLDDSDRELVGARRELAKARKLAAARKDPNVAERQLRFAEGGTSDFSINDLDMILESVDPKRHDESAFECLGLPNFADDSRGARLPMSNLVATFTKMKSESP